MDPVLLSLKYIFIQFHILFLEPITANPTGMTAAVNFFYFCSTTWCACTDQ
jgi:hypothetical protein